MKTENVLGLITDELGLIKADVKALEDKEEALKAELIMAAAEGPHKAFNGRLYRATVSFTQRAVTDWHAVSDRLLLAGVRPEVLAKAVADCTRTAEGLPVVRVSSL